MARYRPSAPFSTSLALLVPTVENIDGAIKKTFPKLADAIRINGLVRSFGGTERNVNGVYSVEDTATVETWYDPRIVSGARVCVLTTGAVYEILGEPENIELRNQYMSFRVTRVKGETVGKKLTNA